MKKKHISIEDYVENHYELGMATLYPTATEAYVYMERKPTWKERLCMWLCPDYEPDTGEVIAHLDLTKEGEEGDLNISFSDDGIATLS